MDAFTTTFLRSCLARYFSYYLLPYPGMFLFSVFLRLCSSHLLLSSKQYMFFLVSSVSCLISEFLRLVCSVFFRSSYFLGGVLVVLLYPGTLALVLPTSITERYAYIWFFCLTV